MRRSPPMALLLVIPLWTGACVDGATDPLDERLAQADARLGALVFQTECAGCHASGDGFDLAFFDFPDTTIVRRAVAHVDTSEALDIVAHVRTIETARLDREARVFQPGDRILDDDRDFAVELFGLDAWPAGLTTRELRGMDPLSIPVALPMPRWSVEGENVDWMPDQPLDAGILAFGRAGDAEEAYRTTPTDRHLLEAVHHLRMAALSRENPRAPCVLEDGVAVEFDRCFQTQRWISTLAAQHMLRRGREGRFHRVVHDAFWDVGQTVRRRIVHRDQALDNGRENWATWMYLGWMFEPGNHASIYTGRGLASLELRRHATFVAVRSQVARGEGSPHPYLDVRNAAAFAPPHWVAAVTDFGYRHLIERLESGERPHPGGHLTLEDLEAAVVRAYHVTERKDPAAADGLRPLRDRILTLLQGG